MALVLQITRKVNARLESSEVEKREKNTDGKRYSSSDKQGERKGEGRESAQKNVSIMEHCGHEQLQAKKRHVVAGRPIVLCVRERLCTATMGRVGSRQLQYIPQCGLG